MSFARWRAREELDPKPDRDHSEIIGRAWLFMRSGSKSVAEYI